MSVHGNVKVYQLTEEERQEVIKKYGPPKQPLNKRRQVEWEWQNLTFQRYKRLMVMGTNDIEICKKYKLTKQALRDLKVQWGMVKKRKDEF